MFNPRNKSYDSGISLRDLVSLQTRHGRAALMLEAQVCSGASASSNVKKAISQQHRSCPGIDCLEGEEMSHKLNFIAALLILSSLCLGTLNALPLHPAPASVQEGGMLVAVMDWIASLFSGAILATMAASSPTREKWGATAIRAGDVDVPVEHGYFSQK